jgi:hypothetical protein
MGDFLRKERFVAPLAGVLLIQKGAGDPLFTPAIRNDDGSGICAVRRANQLAAQGFRNVRKGAVDLAATVAGRD